MLVLGWEEGVSKTGEDVRPDLFLRTETVGTAS